MPQTSLERLRNYDPNADDKKKKRSSLDLLKNYDPDNAGIDSEVVDTTAEDEFVGPEETTESIPRTAIEQEINRNKQVDLYRTQRDVAKKEDAKYAAPAQIYKATGLPGSNIIPTADDDDGPVTTFNRGVIKGMTGTVTGTASGALQAAGDLPGQSEDSKIPGQAASEINKYITRGLSVPISKEDDWGNYWADVAGAGIGSMLPFLAGGMGVKALTNPVGVGKAALKAASTAQAAGGAAMEALVAGANAYDRAKEGGATPWEAAKAAAEVSATTAGTSFVAGKVAFADDLRPAAKIPLTAGLEGGQEVAQGVGEQAATRYYDPNFKAENLTEGWVENFVGGFVGGAAVGSAVSAVDTMTRWGKDETGAPVPTVTETPDAEPRQVTKKEAAKVYQGLLDASSKLTGAKKQQVLDEANKWKEFNERKPQEQMNLDHPEPVPVVWGRNEGMEMEPIEVPADVERDTYLRGALTEQLEQDLQTADPAMQEAIQAELALRNEPNYGEGAPYIDPLFEPEPELMGPPIPADLDLEVPQLPIEKEYPTGQIPFSNEEYSEQQLQQLQAQAPNQEQMELPVTAEQLEFDIPQTKYELAGDGDSWFRSTPKQKLKQKFQRLVDKVNNSAQQNAYYEESIIVDPDGTEYYLPGDVTEHVSLMQHFGYSDVMDAVADGWITYSKNRGGGVNIRYDPSVPNISNKARDIVSNTTDVTNINGFNTNQLDPTIDASMSKELDANLKWLASTDRPIEQLWPQHDEIPLPENQQTLPANRTAPLANTSFASPLTGPKTDPLSKRVNWGEVIPLAQEESAPVELEDPFSLWEDPPQVDPMTQGDLFGMDDATMPPTRTVTQQSLMSPGALQFPQEYPPVRGTTINILGQDVDLNNVDKSIANAFKFVVENNTKTGTGDSKEQLTVTEGSEGFLTPLHSVIESKGTLGQKVSDQLEAVRVRANLVLGELTDLYVKAPLKKLNWEQQVKVGQLLNGADESTVLESVTSQEQRKNILAARDQLRKAYNRVADLFETVKPEIRKKGGKYIQRSEATEESDKGMSGLFSRLENYFPRLLYSGKTYGNVDKIVASQGQKGFSRISDEILYNMQTQYGIPEETARKALAQWIDWRSNQIKVPEGMTVSQAMAKKFPDMLEVLGSLSSERMTTIDLARLLNRTYRSATDVHAPLFGSVEASRTLDVSPFADPNPLRVSDKYFNRASQRFAEIKQLGQYNEKLENLFEQTHKGSVPPALLKSLADDVKKYLYDDESAAQYSTALTWLQRLQTNKLKLAWIGNLLQSAQNARVTGWGPLLGSYKDFALDQSGVRSDARQAGATADIDMNPNTDFMTMGEGGLKQSVKQGISDIKAGAAHRLLGDSIVAYSAVNTVMHRETERWNRFVSTRAGIRLGQKMAKALKSGNTKQVERVKRDLEALQVPYELVEEYGADSREFELMMAEAVNRTINFTSDKLSRPKMLEGNQVVQTMFQFKTYMYGMQQVLKKNFVRAAAAHRAGDEAKALGILATEFAYIGAILPATGLLIGWARNYMYDLAETLWGETTGNFYDATKVDEYEEKVSEMLDENPMWFWFSNSLEAATLGIFGSLVEAYDYSGAKGVAATLVGPGFMAGIESAGTMYEAGKNASNTDTSEESLEEFMQGIATTLAEGIDGYAKMLYWDPKEENKD